MAKRKKSFGGVLRDLRLSSDLFQEDIANICEVTPQFISNWECGRSYPPPERLQAACDEYGWDYEGLSKLIVKEKHDKSKFGY